MNSQSNEHRSAPLRVAAAAIAALAAAAVSAQQPAQQQQRPAAQSPPAARQQPSPYLREDLAEVTATVTAIDPAKRLVALKSDDNREFAVLAGPDVRNFNQIEVGDEVQVQYYQALAAEVTQVAASADQASVVVGERSAEGERPGGSVGSIYTAIVTIDSVDAATGTVSFTGPEGRQREVTAERDGGAAFISQLEPGDRVQLTYAESFAIAVAPAGEGRELR
jgi:hypothetical protein